MNAPLLRSAGPRHVLLRYLSLLLTTRVAMCCAILIALMELLGLLEQMTPILRRHLGVTGVLTYMTLHLPLMLQTALPLSVLVGALLMLTQMTVSNETAILRASGLSTLGLVVRLAPATLALGLFGVVVEDQLTPRSELALAAWWSHSDPHPEDGRSFWFAVPEDVSRSGGVASELAHVGYVKDVGKSAFGVDLYDRDAEGRLLGVTHAARATYDEGGWTLWEVKRSVVAPDGDAARVQVSTEPQVRWGNTFRASDMLRLSMDTAPLSSFDIWRALDGRVATSLAPGYLRAALIERLLRPLALLVMLLLATPVVYIPPRTGMRSWLPVWCLGGGLLFIIVQGMFRAMGNAGLLPAPVATVPGLLIFTMAAGAVLLRNEEQ
ncbi:LptF/LptG family permease [Acetobacter nitrogenifigens]|uniref:LptF/LptG family permease n=1 Tax=Acetobacter nitrogenifigens TaxID=285268 RepID=UPI00047B4B0D|nr:LptF/LptG family permease [Acetobacter nitrogenifigens]